MPRSIWKGAISSGQSMVCITSRSSLARIRASDSRERNATFTTAALPASCNARRSNTYGLAPGPSASRK